MFVRTFTLVRKEFLHIVRDRRTLVVMLVMPAIQLVLMGYAATTDVERLATELRGLGMALKPRVPVVFSSLLAPLPQ